MKKQLLFTVLLMQMIQAESPEAVTLESAAFMDRFERSLVGSDGKNEQNYKKLSEADQNTLKDIANRWMCGHFAERGFASLQDAMKHEGYQHYKCPNVEQCEDIFRIANELKPKPSEKLEELKRVSDKECLRIQEEYKFSDDQMTGIAMYIKYFIILYQK